MNTKRAGILVILWLAVSLASCLATDIAFSGTSGSLAATVRFEFSGGALKVTLLNTSSADVLVPSDALTAVFFDIAGDPILTPDWARVSHESCVLYYDAQCHADMDVGGEWAYVRNMAPSLVAQHYGISSAGFGVFGPGDRFPGFPTLTPPDSPDGLDWALLSAGDNPATGNTGVTNQPLIRNAAVFRFTGLPGGFNPAAAIRNVRFQYGTDLDEPHFDEIPEPATFGLIGLGLVGLGFLGRRYGRRWA